MKFQEKIEYGLTRGYSCAFRSIQEPEYVTHPESDLLHGYALSFTFRFTSDNSTALDAFIEVERPDRPTKFGLIEQYLEEVFRNTVLVEKNDPALEAFQALELAGACELRINEKVGIHLFPKELYDELRVVVQEQSQRQVVLYQVTVSAMGHYSWSYTDMIAFNGEPSTALAKV